MCRVVGRADYFWEASSRRLTWRCRGKRRPIITVTTVMARCTMRNLRIQMIYLPLKEWENFIFYVSPAFDSILREIFSISNTQTHENASWEVKNSAEEGKAKPAATTTKASAKRGQTEEEKKRSNDWLDTSCRTEATVGLIKLRELAEVSSGLFPGVGGGRPRLCCTATQINFPGMALSLRSTHLRNNTR